MVFGLSRSIGPYCGAAPVPDELAADWNFDLTLITALLLVLFSILDRLAACTAQLETGDYSLPQAAPLLWDFQRELLAFPDGRNDDQVDALTQFLNFVFKRRPQPWSAESYRLPLSPPVAAGRSEGETESR